MNINFVNRFSFFFFLGVIGLGPLSEHNWRFVERCRTTTATAKATDHSSILKNVQERCQAGHEVESDTELHKNGNSRARMGLLITWRVDANQSAAELKAFVH